MICVYCIILHFLLCVQQILSCGDGDVRLIAGVTATPLEGRVEVCRGGIWGTICDTHWNDSAATVVCRQLGFPGEGSEALDGAYVSTYISRGRGDIVLDHVECGGSERMIRECRISAQITCDHSNDAGVRCSHRGLPIIVFNGRRYPNNSIIPLQDIGDDFPFYNASVYCYIDHPSCCNEDLASWYIPRVDLDVQISYEHSWSSSGTVNLYRPPSSYLSGVFSCQIFDQFLFVGIYQQGLVIGTPYILSFTYERSSQTFSCLSTGGPATTVSWSKDGVLLRIDGSDYEQSQVVLNLGLATYENKLTIKLSSANDTYGLYRCEVKNVKGNSSAELRVSACNDGDALFKPDTGEIKQICRNGYYYYVTETLSTPTEESTKPTESSIPCQTEQGNSNMQIDGQSGNSNIAVIILGALFGILVVIIIIVIVGFGILLRRTKENGKILQVHNIAYEDTRSKQHEDLNVEHEFDNVLYGDREPDSSSMQYNSLYTQSDTHDMEHSHSSEENQYEVLKEGVRKNIYDVPK